MSRQLQRPIDISLTATATAAIQLPDDSPVACWRTAELTRAGYSAAGAAQLGQWGHIDLHLAVKLRQQDCAEETALAILL